MRRALVLLAVALAMSLGVGGPAWADPTPNSHNCAGATSSSFAPAGTREGQWASIIRPAAQKQQADEVSLSTASRGNCGENSVPFP